MDFDGIDFEQLQSLSENLENRLNWRKQDLSGVFIFELRVLHALFLQFYRKSEVNQFS